MCSQEGFFRVPELRERASKEECDVRTPPNGQGRAITAGSVPTGEGLFMCRWCGALGVGWGCAAYSCVVRGGGLGKFAPVRTDSSRVGSEGFPKRWSGIPPGQVDPDSSRNFWIFFKPP